jgi:5'-nucleotidase
MMNETMRADLSPAQARPVGAHPAPRPARAPPAALDAAVPEMPSERRLRIAVDFDGVLFDHVPYLLRGFRDAHGIDLNEEGLRYWDFFQYRAVRERNLTWNCVRTVLQRIDNDPALHQEPPRDPHARDVMQRWRDQGHEVLIVTARETTARKATELFLRTHDIPHDELVMGASRKTGYDLLVDDAPHNVLMAAAAGGMALLMDHPYNRDVPTIRNPLRVRDWLDVEWVADDVLHRARHAATQVGAAGAMA